MKRLTLTPTLSSIYLPYPPCFSFLFSCLSLRRGDGQVFPQGAVRQGRLPQGGAQQGEVRTGRTSRSLLHLLTSNMCTHGVDRKKPYLTNPPNPMKECLQYNASKCSRMSRFLLSSPCSFLPSVASYLFILNYLFLPLCFFLSVSS